jgi:hypothetical protein
MGESYSIFHCDKNAHFVIHFFLYTEFQGMSPPLPMTKCANLSRNRETFILASFTHILYALESPCIFYFCCRLFVKLYFVH